MDKAAERSMLTYEFGLLMQPFRQLIADSGSTFQSCRVASAALETDFHKWMERVRSYATIGSIQFTNEFRHVNTHLGDFRRFIRELTSSDNPSLDWHSSVKNRLSLVEELVLAAIATIPIEWKSRLFEAKTPFAVYLHVRDAMKTAKVRIHLFDRYLSTDFYECYLRDIDRNLEIRLITIEGNASHGVKCVKPVSARAQIEFKNYKLGSSG